ncbi:hypothetical protein CVO96_00940 [Deinococcus koreensis]|uniref:Uncharacterized protein n=2 Tax=Deinococcus koreensis TaxID=2054903 RepID=A0A2K3UUA3_9DEIO|nr:hypothetical protein CVO96_00940 [Deinococcus koreensis]
MTANLGAAQATVTLLQTVHALSDLLGRGAVRVRPEARAPLGADLAQLSGKPRLTPGEARRLVEAVQSALDSGGQAALERHLAQREQRARLLLSRARLATPDGPARLPLAVLALTVPGGRPVLDALLADPGWNPYLSDRMNTEIVQRLLGQLRR